MSWRAASATNSACTGISDGARYFKVCLRAASCCSGVMKPFSSMRSTM
jgi:hypothetical protein